MKKFFLSVLSSFTGTWLALCLFGIVAVIVSIAMLINIGSSNFSSGIVSTSDNSLLVLDLQGEIIEYTNDQAPDVMTVLNGDFKQPKSLKDLINGIKCGADDDNVKAMYIDCGVVSAAPATLNSLREAIVDFKSKGKKVYAYGETMTQGAYYVATAADSLFMNPHGTLQLSGLGGHTPYFKKLLDKFGIEFQVVKVGTYKSAVEPYILEHMSEPARAQLDTLYNAMWSKIKGEIAASRKIHSHEIDSLINNEFILCRKLNVALDNGLVDGLLYRHEMDSRLAEMMGVEKADNIEKVDPTNLASGNISKANQPHIAVVYACGGIDDGDASGIVSTDLVPLIFDLKDNENVEGLILRVNSPGGSAYGSEQIWEALEQFKKTDKPFIVSMGDYAASGGYYISCGADSIFADPLTVTGSIGIFGLIPNGHELLTDKLGVNFELVATNPQAMFPNLINPLTTEQYNAMQRMVEDGYDLFTQRVADGRGLSQDYVKQIGEGRVWSAEKALEIGLVDRIGTLDAAIKYMAQKLSYGDTPNVVAYPDAKDSFWTYMAMLENGNAAQLAQKLGLRSQEEAMLMQLRWLIQRPMIQARMADMVIKL
ncbi:MAG: signal peptide peptidase SppA [Muribaculaceae bacterium]|nr:signal peptide peptidase SppA [Muribaculaceae bacterium]